jgi:hypothetical protein
MRIRRRSVGTGRWVNGSVCRQPCLCRRRTPDRQRELQPSRSRLGPGRRPNDIGGIPKLGRSVSSSPISAARLRGLLLLFRAATAGSDFMASYTLEGRRQFSVYIGRSNRMAPGVTPTICTGFSRLRSESERGPADTDQRHRLVLQRITLCRAEFWSQRRHGGVRPAVHALMAPT